MAMDLLKLLSNAKTRTLVLLTGTILLSGIFIAIISSSKTGEPLENRTSKTTDVPKNVESTPGAKTSEKYKELQEKANAIGAENAEKKGSTFIPTIVANNNSFQTEAEDLQSQFAKTMKKLEEDSKNTPENSNIPIQDPRLAQMLAQQKQDDAAADALRKQRQEQLETEQMFLLQEQKLKAIETVAKAMEDQNKAALDAWNDVPQQAYFEGDYDAEKINNTNNYQANNANNVDNRPVLLKAGTILFGVLETSVSSEEPGPIMAKIVQTPLKDAKLIGTIENSTEKSEKLSLNFNTINIKTEPASIKINAVAIDPDTARTALASDVDHHYFLRFGTLFGSAFLEGYSKAVAKSGTTTINSIGNTGTTTTTATPSLSGKQQMFEGLGKVGTKLSENLGTVFSTKPTITINSGTGIGILLLSDLKLGPEPQQNNAVQNNTNQNEQINTKNSNILSTVMQKAAEVSNNTTNNINNNQETE